MFPVSLSVCKKDQNMCLIYSGHIAKLIVDAENGIANISLHVSVKLR